MIKTISKIGNSQGLILDSAILQLAHLNVGDEVNLEVLSGGMITVSKVKELPVPEDVTSLIQDTMKHYASSMKNLA